MQWNHLPVAGGLYDQHPGLLEEWEVIFQRQAAWEKENEKKPTPETGPKPARRVRKRGR